MEDYIKNMKTTIIIENGMANILTDSRVGLKDCGLVAGHNNLSFFEAADLIKEFDKIIPNSPKPLQKRLLATRGQISNGFGPDMEEYLLNS